MGLSCNLNSSLLALAYKQVLKPALCRNSGATSEDVHGLAQCLLHSKSMLAIIVTMFRILLFSRRDSLYPDKFVEYGKGQPVLLQ